MRHAARRSFAPSSRPSVWLLLATLLVVVTTLAWAGELDACASVCPAEAEGMLPIPEYGGCWYRRPKLTGDWSGVRTCWCAPYALMTALQV